MMPSLMRASGVIVSCLRFRSVLLVTEQLTSGAVVKYKLSVGVLFIVSLIVSEGWSRRPVRANIWCWFDSDFI